MGDLVVTVIAYLKPLQDLFTRAADPEKAGPMKKYMRDQFEFLGIKSPERQSLFRDFINQNGLPHISELDQISRTLWAIPAREYQYTAMDLLERMRRQITPEFVLLIEFLITAKSWWDTVDGLASHAVGGLFARFPEIRDHNIDRWRRSDNMWLRRTTLLFQMRYKANTDEPLLFSLIVENAESSEFFIQKAIGWALREYSKTNAEAVTDFVGKQPLAPLSHREALKWLKRRQKI